MLGKYRSISSDKGLDRTLDILENHRFYLSSIADLNDPLEGRGMRYPINGYTGMSIHTSADLLPPPVRNRIDGYVALCLSEDCRSPQMWVHYADGFRGVCICVKQDDVFAQARRVDYCTETIDPGGVAIDIAELDSLVYRGLLIKQDGWSYEREYRILQKGLNNGNGQYLSFNRDDIAAMVIGHCAITERAARICEACQSLGVPIYRTRIREMSRQIDVVPYGFKPALNGQAFDEALEEYCAVHSIRPFSELEHLV